MVQGGWPVTDPSRPAGFYPDPDGSGGQRYWDGKEWTETRLPPPSSTPANYAEPAGGGGSRVALLVVGGGVLFVIALIAAAMWLVTQLHFGAIHFGTATSAAPAPSPTSSTSTASSSTVRAQPRARLGQQVRDGQFAFVVTSVDTAPVVADEDNPTITVSSQGTFVIVKMTITNVSNGPGSFLPQAQNLKADGQTFQIRPDAENLLGIPPTGVGPILDPGDQLEVSLAYDVPNGTTPQSIVIRDYPSSAGAEVVFG
jgi:hypothetical protein